MTSNYPQLNCYNVYCRRRLYNYNLEEFDLRLSYVLLDFP